MYIYIIYIYIYIYIIIYIIIYIYILYTDQWCDCNLVKFWVRGWCEEFLWRIFKLIKECLNIHYSKNNIRLNLTNNIGIQLQQNNKSTTFLFILMITCTWSPRIQDHLPWTWGRGRDWLVNVAKRYLCSRVKITYLKMTIATLCIVGNFFIYLLWQI